MNLSFAARFHFGQWWRAIFVITFYCFGCLVQAKPKPVVFIPEKRGESLPVAVWLHGYRSFPGALNDPYFQTVADKLGIAIVGIPGTTTLDDDSLQWSEEPAADHAYIQEVLTNVASEQRVKFDKTALFGFSQGALVAGDLALRWPKYYSGAILMSPGGMAGPHPPKQPAEENKKQVFVVVCGAREHEGNVALTRYFARLANAAGANVIHKEYEGVKEHTRPTDFKERFPEWMTQILGLKSSAK